MELETLVARVGSHWVQLRQSFAGWTFLLWGKYPLSSDLGDLTEREAKHAALKAAQEHLRKHGLGSEVIGIGELRWHIAVRYTA
jgi:hypothetical protein